MKIKIDKDTAYEKRTIPYVVFMYPFILFLNSRIFSNLAHRFTYRSKTAHHVRQHATTHKALEIMYAYDGKMHFEHGFIEGYTTYMLQRVMNARAVRNRLKLVKKRLKNYIENTNKQEITILNLGAGSAPSVLDTIHKFPNRKFNLILLDKSEDALEASKKRVRNLGLVINVEYVQDTVGSIKNRFKNLSADIVEMVGVLDYFDKEKAVRVFDDVYNILKNDGVFITGNILHNKEERFTTNIIGWKLVYRNKNDLVHLIKKSKFNENGASIILEPLKVHAILELHK